MAVIIGSARIDENGHAHGGQAGDQTGREVSTQEFYIHSKGWIVARLKDAKAADTCARAMKTACSNSNIGYDQYQRYGLAPGKEDVDTKKKVETDCSALVRRCIYNATGKDVGDIRTITMESALKKSGLFEELKQYKEGMTLYTGDVLFTGHLGHPVSGHTVVVVSGKSRTKKDTVNVAEPTLKNGDKGQEVATLQKNLTQAGCKGKNGKKLNVDSVFGTQTEYAVKMFQKKYKIEIDGIYGPVTASTMKSVLR